MSRKGGYTVTNIFLYINNSNKKALVIIDYNKRPGFLYV